MKPTPGDILEAIVRAQTGDWIDPDAVPFCWHCELRDPNGQGGANGDAFTIAQAMAMAWLHAWAPEALIDAYVEVGTVPFEVPDGWEFEITASVREPE